MANKNVIDRQHAAVASTPLMGIAQLGAGNGFDFSVRPGTLVLRVGIQTVLAFDSATTTTATITDGTTVFANGVDVKTAGAETIANAPKFYPTGGVISVNLAETGAAATVGSAIAFFEYIILGNGNAGIQE